MQENNRQAGIPAEEDRTFCGAAAAENRALPEGPGGSHDSEIGEAETPKDLLFRMVRQNKLAAFSALVILLIILAAVLAPFLTPYGEAEICGKKLEAPSSAHLFGTDHMGRDILTRILFGARVSMVIGVLPTIISLLIGIIMGLLSGFYRGWVDAVIMRIADIMLAFPSLLLAMVVTYMLGKSTITIFIALALVGWASVARVVRSQTLSLKETEYVEAARSIGVRNIVIMLRHILPNCIPSLIVLFTLNVPSAILSESSLSFLGVGVQPPYASWGTMVSDARKIWMTAPWTALAPSLTIMVVVLAFNFLGDGLRDVLDPYMRKSL